MITVPDQPRQKVSETLILINNPSIVSNAYDPVIPATQEVLGRRIKVQGQPRAKTRHTT
jgi:hypothetical protein